MAFCNQLASPVSLDIFYFVFNVSELSLFPQTFPFKKPCLVFNQFCDSVISEVERHYGNHKVQPPCSKWGQLQQVAQAYVQSYFEHLQEWRLFNLSEQPIPVVW